MMKALVAYDSTWGNTEKIARAIAEGFGDGTNAVQIATVDEKELGKIDLLVIGSPVVSGRSSLSIQGFMKSIPTVVAAKLKIASFDTRLSSPLAKMLGNASSRMARQFEQLGSEVIAKPEGFIVKGQKGPLADGEIDRATQWGRDLSGR